MCGFSSRAVAGADGGRGGFLRGERAGRPADSCEPAALLELADLPAVVPAGRTDRRLRHRRGPSRRRRTAPDGGRRRGNALLMALANTRLPDWLGARGGSVLPVASILVTGATGGLGGEVARAAARAGATVVMTGRKLRLLEKLYDELVAEGLRAARHPSAGPGKRHAERLRRARRRHRGRASGGSTASCMPPRISTELTPIAMHKPDDWLRAHAGQRVRAVRAHPGLHAAAHRARPTAPWSSYWTTRTWCRARTGVRYGVSKAALERMADHPASRDRQAAVARACAAAGTDAHGAAAAAYYGEDTMQRPLPAVTAEAAIYLLSACRGARARRVLDLRTHRSHRPPARRRRSHKENRWKRR